MLKTQRVQFDSPGVRLALQGLGLALLAFLLFPALSQSTGLLLCLGVTLAGFGLAMLIERPHWGVMAILLIAFISVDTVDVPFLGLPYVLSALLLIPLSLTILRERDIWVWRVPQIQILLTLGILFLISTAWSYVKYPVTLFPELDETPRMLTLFFSRLGFLVFLLYFIKTNQRIESLVKLIVGMTVVVAIEALYSSVMGGKTQRAHASFSAAENSNRLAYLCLFATSLVWFYRSYGLQRQWKSWTVLLLFPLLSAALAAGSRSGLLQLTLLIAFILKEQKEWPLMKRARAFFLLGIVGVVAIIAVPAHIRERLITYDTAQGAQGYDSLRNRLNTDFVALEIALENSFLGVGIGNFRWVRRTYSDIGRASKSHNSYLWAWTSAGIGALALYLLLFYVTYRDLRQLERAGPPELVWLSKSLKVNLLMFLIFTAFADFWLSNFLYIIVGLPACMMNLWQHQRSQLSRSYQRPQLSRPLPLSQRASA